MCNFPSLTNSNNSNISLIDVTFHRLLIVIDKYPPSSEEALRRCNSNSNNSNISLIDVTFHPLIVIDKYPPRLWRTL